jgi:hypothetical protein
MARIAPAVESRSCQAAPPGLAFEAHRPGVGGFFGEADQSVAPSFSSFFLSYPGSGLMIHCLARSQRTPIRESVARMVSPLTRSFVMPSSKLTSAAISRVHRLLSLPNFRGVLVKHLPQLFGPLGIEGPVNGMRTLRASLECRVPPEIPAR